VLNDIWNTAPYLHDGSAHTLLDVVRPCNLSLDDCLEPDRGRNLRVGGVNGQEMHGATSFLTPQQLNDLVDFQNSLTLGAVIGTNERVLNAGTLTLKRVVFTRPKQKKKREERGQYRCSRSGPWWSVGERRSIRGRDRVGRDAEGHRMVIVERQLQMHGSRGKQGSLSPCPPRRRRLQVRAEGQGWGPSRPSTRSQDPTVSDELGKTGDRRGAVRPESYSREQEERAHAAEEQEEGRTQGQGLRGNDDAQPGIRTFVIAALALAASSLAYATPGPACRSPSSTSRGPSHFNVVNSAWRFRGHRHRRDVHAAARRLTPRCTRLPA
jgi:hypothetical protein